MLSVRLLGAPLHPHTLRGPARALSGTRTLTLLLSLSPSTLHLHGPY